MCRYVDNPDFTPEVVAKQSNAAKSLCIWVHAMDKFHIVNKVVEPKKAKLAKAESELEEANAKLKEKQDALQGVMDRVAALVAKLEQAQQEQQDLNDQVRLDWPLGRRKRPLGEVALHAICFLAGASGRDSKPDVVDRLHSSGACCTVFIKSGSPW